jgi:hypothetical protein
MKGINDSNAQEPKTAALSIPMQFCQVWITEALKGRAFKARRTIAKKICGFSR